MLQLQRQQQHCSAAAEGKNCAARARNYKRHLRLAHRRQQNKQKTKTKRSRNIVRHKTLTVGQKGIIGNDNKSATRAMCPADKCQKILTLFVIDQ